jgi:hypothetical protein
MTSDISRRPVSPLAGAHDRGHDHVRLQREDARPLCATRPGICSLYRPVARRGDGGRPTSLPTAPDADRHAAAERQQRGLGPALLLHGDARPAGSGAPAHRRAVSAAIPAVLSVEEVTLLLRAAEVCLDEGQATSFGPARQETGRSGCQRGWLRPNFVAVCLDETKNRARRARNPGNVGLGRATKPDHGLRGSAAVRGGGRETRNSTFTRGNQCGEHRR